jgi:nitroreductase
MNHANASQIFDQIVQTRRAIRVYDPANYDPISVTKSLERAILAPNSSNMQLWEFYRVSTKELIESCAVCCMNQSAAKTAQELVVVVVRPDLWMNRAEQNLAFVTQADAGRKNFTGSTRIQYYKKLMPMLYNNDILGVRGWLRKIFVSFVGIKKPMVRQVLKSDIRVVLHKSAALAAQTFMLSMVAEEHDTCPMEGFDSLRLKKVLNLPAKAEINMVISCGKRMPEGVYGERFRIPSEQVIFQK